MEKMKNKTLFDETVFQVPDTKNLLRFLGESHLELDAVGETHIDEDGRKIVDKITNLRGVSWVKNQTIEK